VIGGRYEPTPAEKAALRERVWTRDGGKCVVCGTSVILERGTSQSMHCAHVKSKGASGEWTEDNMLTKCPFCHIQIEHAYGKSGVKPVPRKGNAMEQAGGQYE
jgi:5-methylcytosine-specific restriction endonuclease McrA